MGFHTDKDIDIYKEFRQKIAGSLLENPRIGDWDPLLIDAIVSGWFNREKSELFTDMSVTPADRVLDFGCGDGAYAGFCAELGARMTIADVDVENLERADQRVAEMSGQHPERILLEPGSALCVNDQTYTRVICVEVLEHTRDPEVVLDDLIRVGVPGALYLLSVPAPESEQLQKLVAPDILFREPNHIQLFERDQFRSMVENSGLEVLRQDYAGFFWSIWWVLFWLSREASDTSSGTDATDLWLEVWVELLKTDAGRIVKNQLDRLIPKSQIIVARKPG